MRLAAVAQQNALEDPSDFHFTSVVCVFKHTPVPVGGVSISARTVELGEEALHPSKRRAIPVYWGEL